VELLDHRLIKILNLHRTLSGSAKSIQDLAVVLVKTIGLEMARREAQRFTYMSAGVIELLGSGMADLESLIFQKAVDIANANTGVKLTAPIIRGLMAEHIGPVGTATGMMKSSRLNMIARVSNTMARLNAEGYSRSDIRNAIIGSQSQGYKNGVLGSFVNGSHATMRTVGAMASEVASDSERRKNRDVTGYIWVSVLDGNTTLTCASLNGKKYYYDSSGAKPLPPQHVGCRSTTEPITKSSGIPVVASIGDFIKRNPAEAREMLGATRYKLVTDGKLKIDRFTDRHFTPLTIEQLKEKNAVAFKRIEK